MPFCPIFFSYSVTKPNNANLNIWGLECLAEQSAPSLALKIKIFSEKTQENTVTNITKLSILQEGICLKCLLTNIFVLYFFFFPA